MTHEQKPESAEFRTREEQFVHLTGDICLSRPSTYIDRNCARRHIREAEARGAAEQRRKYAEGAVPAGYASRGALEHLAAGNGIGIQNLYRSRDEYWMVPLYTRPANVAALIAEAVAAERERCAKVCEAEAVLGVSSDPTDIAYIAAVSHCAAAIREGGEG